MGTFWISSIAIKLGISQRRSTVMDNNLSNDEDLVCYSSTCHEGDDLLGNGKALLNPCLLFSGVQL
uniref:Uncharacterized protein n=1 Tax=Megaselia scalaris TaxID=36166 RepID=T1GQZ9_MEGSC